MNRIVELPPLKIFILAIALATFSWLFRPTWAYATDIQPKSLLVDYSWPSSINGTYTVDGAAADLGQYNYVVLGDGLEETTHGDHANTVAILAHADMANTSVFGYIDLGVSTQNLSMADIETHIDEWQTTGAVGIFLDDFGYDFQTSRSRQNEAVEYAHSKGLSVVANGWEPADVFGSDVDATYNPDGFSPSLNSDDYYLYESYQVNTGAYESETNWRTKADQLASYQSSIAFKVLAVTTNDATDTYDENKFFYAWYSGLLSGYEAVGWGDTIFGADDAILPFHTPPTVDVGTSFVGDIIETSPVYSRMTDTGKIAVDASSNSYSFTNLPDLSVTSVTSDVTTATAGGNATITVAIQNNGSADSGDLDATVSIDGTTVSTVSIASIAAGAASSFTYTYSGVSISPNPHVLMATLDPSNAIEEISETNNTGSLSLAVQLSAPTLVFPVNLARIRTTTPILRWQAVSGAQRYQVTVTTSTGTVVARGILLGNGKISYTYGNAFDISVGSITALTDGTSYRWSVRASANGSYGPASSFWHFTVALPH